MDPDPRLDYPATGRNRDALIEALSAVLAADASVLEIASGSGQHGRAFVEAFPGVRWQPSSYEPQERASIDAWADGHPRLGAALDLDVRTEPWPVARHAFDALFCANMIHIAPWACTEGLFRGAAHAVREAGPVVLYGPFDVPWQPMADSNRAFDARLRERDPSWGVRALVDVEAVAQTHGFTLEDTRPMPANNLTLVFRR